jgi:hypothetical protein
MKQWRVVSREDKLGNLLWSLQYDVIWLDGSQYGLWREDRVFRDEDMAMTDLAFVQSHPETT